MRQVSKQEFDAIVKNRKLRQDLHTFCDPPVTSYVDKETGEVIAERHNYYPIHGGNIDENWTYWIK